MRSSGWLASYVGQSEVCLHQQQFFPFPEMFGVLSGSREWVSIFFKYINYSYLNEEAHLPLKLQSSYSDI